MCCDHFGETAASSEEDEKEEEEEGVNMSCTLFKHGFKKKITFAYFYWSLRRLLATKRRRNIKNGCNKEQKRQQTIVSGENW